MSNQMWGGRFAAGPDAIMEAINASIDFDQRALRAGHRRLAWRMPPCWQTQGIMSRSDASAIRRGPGHDPRRDRGRHASRSRERSRTST